MHDPTAAEGMEGKSEPNQESPHEWSAGGLVVRRRAASEGLELLMIQHRSNGGWSFPKGWVEPDETPEHAAVREVEEESGARAEILAELPSTHYAFTNQERQRVTKSVTWYLMRYLGDGNQTHAFEVNAVAWVPLEVAHARLAYRNDKDLFSVALGEIMRSSFDLPTS